MASWAGERSGDQTLKPKRLVCVECGRRTTGPEKEWRAVLAGGVEDELEVAVCCPACAEREFGEDAAGYAQGHRAGAEPGESHTGSAH
jgi:hypothetical protein